MATQGTNDNGSERNKPRGDYSYRRGKAEDKNGQERYGKPVNRGSYKSGTANGQRYTKNDEKSGYGSKKFVQKFSQKDKDDEDEDLGRRSKPSRPKESKASVSIPDKNKAMLRLEKEQKSIKKKQSKKRESSRPQPKVKRANNVNYTRSYANGDFDDYFDDYE